MTEKVEVSTLTWVSLIILFACLGAMIGISLDTDKPLYSLAACRSIETNVPHTDLCKLSIPRNTLAECQNLVKYLAKRDNEVYNICVVEPNRLGEGK